MENLLIDFHIHTVYSQEICAHLSVKDTLDYYQKLGSRAEKRVIIRVNDHDNFYGGVKAVEYYLAHKADYPNIFVVPGIEFNVNLGSAFKFKKDNYTPNSAYPDEDDKYDFIFKKAHIGAAPIIKDLASFERWKNNKDLQVYSKLAKMFLNRAENQVYNFDDMAVALSHDQRMQLSNTGDQIIASKNLIRKRFGVIIPFSYLEPCVKVGQTHLEIVDTFLNLATDYMSKNYPPYSNLPTDKIRKNLIHFLSLENCIDMNPVLSTNELIDNACHLLEKEYDIEISKDLIKDCLDCKLTRDKRVEKFHDIVAKKLVGHPKCANLKEENIKARLKQLTFYVFAGNIANKFYSFGGLRRIHIDEMCKMVYEAGGLIDMEHPDKGFEIHQDKLIPNKILSKLDYSVLKTKDRDDVRQKLAQGKDMSLNDLLGENCAMDRTGLVRLQLLRYGMKQNGIMLNNDMMGVELTKFSMKNTRHLNSILRVMENNRFLVSYGTDKHLNILDYYMFSARDKEYREDYDGNKRIIDEDYLKGLLQRIKKEKELPYEFEKYTIPTQTTQTVCVFDKASAKVDKYKAYSNLVKQSAFCDAVLGKEIDFTKSNMFSVKLGALVNDEQYSHVNDSPFNDIMKIIYRDLHQTQVKMGENNFTKQQLAEIKEYSKNQVLELKKNTDEKDEDAISTFLGKIIIRNRLKLKEYLNENMLNK